MTKHRAIKDLLDLVHINTLYDLAIGRQYRVIRLYTHASTIENGHASTIEKKQSKGKNYEKTNKKKPTWSWNPGAPPTYACVEAQRPPGWSKRQGRLRRRSAKSLNSKTSGRGARDVKRGAQPQTWDPTADLITVASRGIRRARRDGAAPCGSDARRAIADGRTVT